MVLDRFFNPRLLRMKPVFVIPTTFFFVLLGFLSAYAIFPTHVSIVMLTLSSLMILPYVVKIFEFDELNVDIDCTSKEDLGKWVRKCLRDGFTPQQIKDSLIKNNIEKPYELMYDLTGVDEEYVKHIGASSVISRHNDVIRFYVYMFLGMFAAYLFLFTLLGVQDKALAFENQLDAINTRTAGRFSLPQPLSLIISNNLWIIIICVILSLVYGAGSVFVLNYNASLAGVVFGSSISSLIFGGRGILPNPVLYLPHTSIELLSFLLAAISGGILAKAIIGDYPGGKKILIKDSGLLFIISVILMVVAATIEINVI